MTCYYCGRLRVSIEVSNYYFGTDLLDTWKLFKYVWADSIATPIRLFDVFFQEDAVINVQPLPIS